MLRFLIALLAAFISTECRERPNHGFQKFDKNARNGVGFQKPDDIPGYPDRKPNGLVRNLDAKYKNKIKNQHARMKRDANNRRHSGL